MNGPYHEHRKCHLPQGYTSSLSCMPAERLVQHKTCMLGPKRNVVRIEYLELLPVSTTENVFGDGHNVYHLVVTPTGDGVDLGIVAHGGTEQRQQ